MIPGKVDAVTCGQTINLRLPYGLLVSIGIEDGLKVQGGQNAMIKRETTDTIPMFHVAQQFITIDVLIFKSKLLFSPRHAYCVYARFSPCTLILRRDNLANISYQAKLRGVPRVKTVRQ
jgi:hypothetical protein